MVEYVVVRCGDCGKELGFASRPKHIPHMLCIPCKVAEVTAEKEYWHPED